MFKLVPIISSSIKFLDIEKYKLFTQQATQMIPAACISPTTGTAPELFASAFKYFMTAQCLINENWLPDYDVENYETFDYIIVGAGTAGCVIANRLSEDKHRNVLLIEAGGDPPVETIIPGADKGVFQTTYDWQYKTMYNCKTNAANKNRSVNWPRGKMLGGSSNINAMIYIKGNTNDYQKWYDAGNKEWHPEVVKRFFKKAESLQDQELLKDTTISENYGHSGPLVVNTFNSTYRPLTLKILESWEEIGIKTVNDLNSANVLGGGIIRATASNGIRNSAVKAYLNPIQNRTNFKIMKNSYVTKVLINDKTKKAFGVEVERYGKKMKIFANLDIILSAGSINTPQLLMLSGVGPKDHLLSKNIKCIVDLPMVGQNLQDHCTIPITIYGNYPGEINIGDKYFGAIKYLYNRTGYLAQNSILDILAFYSTDKNTTITDYESHVNIFWKNSSTIEMAFSKYFNYKDVVVNDVVKKNKRYALYYIMFNLLHPRSRGHIFLSSDNPMQHPNIYANYFKDERDLESAVTGIRIMSKVVKTKFFKSINAFLGRMKWPACDKFVLDSKDYWKCICINMVTTVYHPVGTSKMGTDRNNSVVDGRLRVHGLKGLRVIDAGIMPTITSGNTNGPTIMIGERGADLVKEDHKEP